MPTPLRNRRLQRPAVLATSVAALMALGLVPREARAQSWLPNPGTDDWNPATAPNSDLTIVNGNLALGGTLNITGLSGFATGSYDLFNYTGSLTAGTISLGALPLGFTSSNFKIQTTVAHQVDLVVTASSTVQYWNGSTTTANGVVNGGGGVWDNVTPNWTNAAGTTNVAWAKSVAIFSAGGGTTSDDAALVTIDDNITAGTVGFAAGSGTYDLSVGAANESLTLNGTGINNTSQVVQTFTTQTGGTLNFSNSANAGTSAQIINIGGTGFNVAAGATNFQGASSAGAASIINQGTAVFQSGGGGVTTFQNTSTAANATIVNQTGAYGHGVTVFKDTSTAGHANITNQGVNALGNGFAGYTLFYNHSTAGNATITNQPGLGGGGLGGITVFYDNSSVGSATITNQSATATDAFGGLTIFLGSATAGTATIINQGGTVNSTIAPGNAQFGNPNTSYNPTGGNATIINNGGTTAGASGGFTVFTGMSTAGNATITTNGGTNGGAGGATYIENAADGGNARAITNGNGIFVIEDEFASVVHLGSIEGSGTYYVGGGLLGGTTTLLVGSNNLSTTVSGVIADALQGGGSGSLAKVGTGTLTLTGANTYIGPTNVSGGALQVGNGVTGSLADSAVTVSDTGSLVIDLPDTFIFTQNVTLSATGAALKAIQTGTNTMIGVIGGIGAFDQNGTGTTIFANTESYTGATAVNDGALQIGNGLAGNLAAASTVTVANNATLVLDLADGAKFASKVKLNGGAATVEAVQSGTNTFSGVISGLGFFNQNGTGTTILTGLETYTGATNVNAGTLEVDGALAAGNTLNVTTAGTLTGKGKINGQATLTGDGIIDLGSTSNIAGTLGVIGGNWNGLGTVTGLVTSSSGNFTINGSLAAPAGLDVTGGTLAGAGTLTGTLNYTSAASSTFDGTIAGTASTVIMNGPFSTLALTGANTYTGVTKVSAGTLEVDGSLAAGTTVNVGTAGTLTGSGTIHGKATLTGNGTIDLGANGDIGGTLTVTGGNWNGVGMVNGLVTSSAGIFTIEGTLTTPTGLAVTGGSLAGAGTLAGNLNYTSATSSTFGGIAGNSTLTVSSGSAPSPIPVSSSVRSTPSLTLTGISTYTGATTINRGGLVVNGSLANTAVAVNNGGALEGTGIIAGPVTVNSGGTLAPGGDSDPGTLTLGALSLTAGSTVDYRLGAAGATGAGVNDLTVVNGNLALGGKLNITGLFGFGAGTYDLFNYTGALQLGSTLSLGTLPAGYTASNFTIQTSGNQVDLVVSGGPAVQYWSGGPGTWDNVTINWTNPAGTMNTIWQQSVAVFSTGSGPVNIGSGNMIGITVSALGFLPGSGAYTFLVGTDKTLTITGAGIINNSGVAQNFVTAAPSPTSDEFGTIEFTHSASAGNATITNVGSGIQFNYGGQTRFSDTATAGNATITNQGATVSSANGSQTAFDNTSTAGSATIINDGGTDGGGGGGTYFLTSADGGTAQAITNGNGFVDISGLTDAGMKIGSIEGGGFYYLGSKTLTVGGNNLSTTVAGIIADGGFFHGVGGSLVKTGLGTLTLTGANTYTGGTTVNAGTLQVGDGTSGSLASASAVTVGSNATLTLDLADGGIFSNKVTDNGHLIADDAPTSNYTIGGAVGGSGNLTKTGANTVAVTGANTYSGGTAVNGGTLLVNNTTGSATGTGAVTVNDGGTLGGRGRISGAVTLNSGGALFPSAGPFGTVGTTLHGSSLIWNSGGTLTLQLGASADDALALTGALTKGTAGTYTLDLINAGLIGTNTYNLTLLTFASSNFTAANFNVELPVNYTGTLVKTNTSLEIENLTDPPPSSGELPRGEDLAVTGTVDGDLSTPSDLTVTPTPEPGSALLLAFGGAALLGWRRRRTGKRGQRFVSAGFG